MVVLEHSDPLALSDTRPVRLGVTVTLGDTDALAEDEVDAATLSLGETEAVVDTLTVRVTD